MQKWEMIPNLYGRDIDPYDLRSRTQFFLTINKSLYFLSSRNGKGMNVDFKWTDTFKI